MSQQNIKCQICGGSEFTLETGFYFCSQCNTQSQEVREDVYDEYFSGQKVTTRVLQNKSKLRDSRLGSDQASQLTSWELLNYVLKGVVGELVGLGASPRLKLVVLQLWATYLRKQEVAFTSVKIERKPRLGYTFKKRDAQIVYGLSEDLLKKSWRSRSMSPSSKATDSESPVSDVESQTSASSAKPTRRSVLKRLSIRKKALATAQYSHVAREATVSVSRSLEDLDSASEVASVTTPSRMKLTKHTKSLLKTTSGSSTGDDSSARRYKRKIESKSLRNVSVFKLVAIVNIALALLHQDIQMSDFIRWVAEGHVSLGSSRKFLPEETKLNTQLLKAMEMEHISYLNCQELIATMCFQLDVGLLPIPDLSRLAQRYCLELQLPGELTEIVQKLLVLVTSQPQNPWNWGSSELLVMAAIIVVMKLLFSLDDCTEIRLSHTAAEINRVKKEEESLVLLFSWSEWVEYVECRKAVVAAHHLPTRVAVYGEAVGRDINLFMQQFTQTTAQMPDVKVLDKKKALQKDWVELIQRNLAKLVAKAEETSAEDTPVQFPPSLTPLHSYTQLLLTQHTPAAHVLRQDFTRHSLQHIIAPDKIIAFGLASDLHIKREQSVAVSFEKERLKTCRVSSNRTVIPRSRINQTNLTAKITDKSGNLVQELSKTDEFLRDFNELVSDDSDDEEEEVRSDSSAASRVRDSDLCSASLELFVSASQYWVSHFTLNRNTSNEDFVQFAMQNFSSSFFWLLNECSRTISVEKRELYTTLIALERQLISLNKIAKFGKIKKQTY